MGSEDFSLALEEHTVKGRVFYPSEIHEETLGLVILCHGIPGGRKDPHDQGYPQLAASLSREGYQAVMFNFRGTGKSTGDFDIMGWVEDLRSVLDYSLTDTIGFPQTVLFGFSAGAAVAVHAAAHDNRITSLVLCGCPAGFNFILSETGTDQFLEHAQEMGIISTPDFPSDRSSWVEAFHTIRPERWISEIKARAKLILHGDNDEVVPVEHAYRLFQTAQEPKELIIIKNGGHRLRLNEEAMRCALDWIKKALG